MSYSYVIDSSAWVEYLDGTPRGTRVQRLIEEEAIATSIIGIAEIAYKYERENQRTDAWLKFIESRSSILPVTVPIAREAAALKKKIRVRKQKFSLADGIHLATARLEGATLVTADTDFSEEQNVKLV